MLRVLFGFSSLLDGGPKQQKYRELIRQLEPNMTCLTKLEEFAFLAIYRNVVDQLLPVSVHHKSNIQCLYCNVDDQSDGEPSPQDGEKERQAARHHLSLKTSGSKNREIRLKLLKHFSQEEETQKLRLSCFLDVVLDESFDELSLSFFDEDEPFDDLILPTVARRCPLLSTINITFSSNAKTETCQHLPKVLTCSLAPLQQLTCLNLSKLPAQFKSLAFMLGRSCNLLQKLRIDLSDESLTAKELISVFYSADGARLEEAAPLLEDDGIQRRAYHKCQVSRKALYPFCQTLEEVRINCVEENDPYIIGFLLRHLPQLKEFETSDFEYKDYSTSIRILWDIWDQSIGVSTVRCIEPHSLVQFGTAHVSIFDDHPDLILQSYFTGKFIVFIL